jgi:hypothetical protein
VVRVGGRGVVLERLVMRDVVILVAVVVGTGGRPADPADRDANRVHRIAETLVGRRLDGELSLELVGYEGGGRLRASGRGGEAGRWPETTLEPAPTQAGGVEVVADVPTG